MLEEIKQAREINRRIADLDANLAVIEEHWEVIDADDCQLVTRSGGKVRAVSVKNHREALKNRLANSAKPILAELKGLHQPADALEPLPPLKAASASDIIKHPNAAKLA